MVQVAPPIAGPIVESTTGMATRSFQDWLLRLWQRTGGNTDAVAANTPTGTVVMYAGATSPSGWLLCDGSEVSRTTFNALFQAIGTTYGSSGPTTFRLPDGRGRAAIGAGQGQGLTNRALGSSGGAETHTLTKDQLPSYELDVTDPGHAHTFTGTEHTHTITDPEHTHTVTDPTHNHGTLVDGAGAVFNTGTPAGGTAGTTDSSATGVTVDPNATGVTVNNATAGGSIGSEVTGVTVSSGGNGQSHNNMQPFLSLNLIIKT